MAIKGDLGWKKLLNAAKWHYFKEDGRSMCGAWMALGTQPGEFGNNASTDNCKACVRKLEARPSR